MADRTTPTTSLFAGFDLPFDLYGSETLDSPSEASVGDVIVHLPPSRRYVRNERDFLLVVRVDASQVVVHRVFPQEWERELEYVVGDYAFDARAVQKIAVEVAS